MQADKFKYSPICLFTLLRHKAKVFELYGVMFIIGQIDMLHCLASFPMIIQNGDPVCHLLSNCKLSKNLSMRER